MEQLQIVSDNRADIFHMSGDEYNHLVASLISYCERDTSLIPSRLYVLVAKDLIERQGSGRLSELSIWSRGDVSLSQFTTEFLVEALVDSWLEQHGFRKINALDVHAHVSNLEKLFEDFQELEGGTNNGFLSRFSKGKERPRTELRRKAEMLVDAVRQLEQQRTNLGLEVAALHRQTIEGQVKAAETIAKSLDDSLRQNEILRSETQAFSAELRRKAVAEAEREVAARKVEKEILERQIAELQAMKSRLTQEHPEALTMVSRSGMEEMEWIEKNVKFYSEVLKGVYEANLVKADIDYLNPVHTKKNDFCDAQDLRARFVLNPELHNHAWKGLSCLFESFLQCELTWGIKARQLYCKLAGNAVNEIVRLEQDKVVVLVADVRYCKVNTFRIFLAAHMPLLTSDTPLTYDVFRPVKEGSSTSLPN